MKDFPTVNADFADVFFAGIFVYFFVYSRVRVNELIRE